MGGLRDEPERHGYTELLIVTCPECGKTDTVTPKQRNNSKFAGLWCDGPYPNRHPVRKMVGPMGKGWE